MVESHRADRQLIDPRLEVKTTPGDTGPPNQIINVERMEPAASKKKP